jgi:hypothetical protein
MQFSYLFSFFLYEPRSPALCPFIFTFGCCRKHLDIEARDGEFNADPSPVLNSSVIHAHTLAQVTLRKREDQNIQESLKKRNTARRVAPGGV